ncbi:unnamed protein product, partial [Brassica oleracea]
WTKPKGQNLDTIQKDIKPNTEGNLNKLKNHRLPESNRSKRS